MFTRTSTTKYIDAYSQKIDRLRRIVASSDAVVVGAGAGLSASAGFEYSGGRFERYFSDFIEKYGFRDMYSAGFYPFDTPEERWAYWSRYVYINRYLAPPKPVYANLLELVKGRDYFVITTNVDHCFQNAGFDKKRLFYTQGDYGLFQCSGPCCRETWDNRELIMQMVEQQRDMRVPSALLPVCPHCGRPLSMNLRADDRFVQDDGWYQACRRYEEFLQALKGRRVLFLELGVGYNTPAIIKLPFWKMTAGNPDAAYACINRGEAAAPGGIRRQSVCIDGDIGDVLERLLSA